MCTMNQDVEEERNWRLSWRSQERRSTECSSEGGEIIWQQCAYMSEAFCQCYVKGGFFMCHVVC